MFIKVVGGEKSLDVDSWVGSLVRVVVSMEVLLVLLF